MSNNHMLYRCKLEEDEDFHEMPDKFYLDHEAAAAEYCRYVFYNRDGWDWMDKDRGRTVVVVEDNGGRIKKFTFEIEYEPTFECYEKK